MKKLDEAFFARVVQSIREDSRLSRFFKGLSKQPEIQRNLKLTRLIEEMKSGKEDARLIASLEELRSPAAFSRLELLLAKK